MMPDDRIPPTTDPLVHSQRRARRPSGADTPLHRSRDERLIAGVCGGIAAFTGARPVSVRVLYVISLLPSLGLTLLAYPMLWWLLPPDDAAEGPPIAP